MKGYIKRHKLLTALALLALVAIPMLVWAQTAGYSVYYNLELIDNPYTSDATEGNLRVGNGSNGVTLNGEDAYIEGTLEVDSTANFDGTADFDGATDFSAAVTFSGAGTLSVLSLVAAGTVTLDDGTGASPSFVLQDETNETATFSKVDAGRLTLTTDASDGFNVLTGSLFVGNGVPGQTINGEDLYVEGISEFANNITVDDGTGSAPTLTFIDGTDETAVFTKQDAGTIVLATDATDGLQINTGNLRVGNGTPATTQNGEDFYVDGTSEFGSNVAIDDSTGASPTLSFVDSDDETAVFVKNQGAAASGTLDMTIAAGDALRIMTGNLWIGNGSPTTTQNGEDLYVEGISEFTGASTHVGAVTMASTLTGWLRPIVIYNDSSTPRVITVAESGTTFVVQTATSGAVNFTLPAAVAGLHYIFTDLDTTDNDDLQIDVDNADQIENLTAGHRYSETGNAFGASIQVIAVDATNWVVITTKGTWGTMGS